MDTADLFKGIAVIIDDEINDSKANIQDIILQIEKEGIPYITYRSIPDLETISHFQNISFLLFDWLLIAKDLVDEVSAGVRRPGGLQDHQVQENLEFLRNLKESCFCPVFVFSNEEPGEIENILAEAGMYSTDTPNHLFVKSKTELKGTGKLFLEIEKWIETNPTVYVLKAWEKGYQKSKNQLYIDFQKLSPVWPKVMWDTYSEDGINESHELGELILRNLHTRMVPYEFSEEILGKPIKEPSKEELRKVLEGERFLTNDGLQIDNIMPGDIFYCGQNYYINIRPACDCIPGRQDTNANADNVSLYLLKGTKLTVNQEKDAFHEDYGQFIEKPSMSIVFAIHNGKTISFRFRDLEIKAWREMKNSRIGRLLPPYIDRIQERYALYLQRHGLPRTPKKAI